MGLPTRLLPYDLFERHEVVRRLLERELALEPATARVLDVGGQVGLLRRFFPCRVVAVNPDGSGDLVASGLELPFASGSFDVAVAIDTLEHLPAGSRLPMLGECLRVARRGLVVAAPFGSPEHVAYERELDRLHVDVVGKPHRYLREHLEHGLPTPGDLDEIERGLAPARVRRFFAGDYVWQGRCFARSVEALGRPWPFARLASARNRLASLALLHPIRLSERPRPRSNRFYLLVERETFPRVSSS